MQVHGTHAHGIELQAHGGLYDQGRLALLRQPQAPDRGHWQARADAASRIRTVPASGRRSAFTN